MGLPILAHCYREFVIFFQHCIRQRFDGRAARRAPARPAASSAALSCPGCSAGPSCPAPAPGGLATSQPLASATPQPHAACDAARQPRRARCRSRCRPQTREMMRFSATAAAAALARPRSSSSRFVPTTFVTCSIEERHRARHSTRRQICSRSGEAYGSMREGCAPSARRDSSKCKRRQAWTPTSTSRVTQSSCRERRQLLGAARLKGSSRGWRTRPTPLFSQRAGPRRCGNQGFGRVRPPGPEELKDTRSPGHAELSLPISAPIATP